MSIGSAQIRESRTAFDESKRFFNRSRTNGFGKFAFLVALSRLFASLFPWHLKCNVHLLPLVRRVVPTVVPYGLFVVDNFVAYRSMTAFKSIYQARIRLLSFLGIYITERTRCAEGRPARSHDIHHSTFTCLGTAQVILLISFPFCNVLQSKMVVVAVQPPSRAQPGFSLYPPIVVKSRINTQASGAGFTRLFAVAFLLDSDGEVVEDKSSGISATGHEIDDIDNLRRVCTIFAFPYLKLLVAGDYTIRVHIYSNEDGATFLERIQTNNISVHDEVVPIERPCRLKSCHLILDILADEFHSCNRACSSVQTSRKG